MRARRSFNTKRKLCPTSELPVDLSTLAARVGYGGNPEHKRNPGDFGLTPPAAARADKSLCDAVQVSQRAQAVDLLRAGIRRGMISSRGSGSGFPQNVWSLTADGAPLEAQLENTVRGTYHGYPLPKDDPMYETIVREWHRRGDLGGKDV
ncbi:hypothetical protein CKO31_04665 [Thiohalocapsa halophila]|uniref:Uncharacterized protein n=2 Tax=Thiohalocapsa halophila TaxID=69359 RepID=A0ABS1CE08_9GAMM|nr:hypothetical protein [Thiohalocapsa halophila]